MTAVSEGGILDAQRTGRWPRVVREQGMWYREVQKGPETHRQLLLPEALRQAHNHLWARGQEIPKRG